MPDADDDRWMTSWMALIRTHARLLDHVESQLREEHGLTLARYDVLAQLDLAGGRLGLSELASSIALSPSGLSKLLDRMEASGLVRRNVDTSDARATFAVLTARGRTLVRKARTSHHAFLRDAFGKVLDDRDVADLTRVMGRLSASIARR
jgi:DNA-binding MarR family transcriptional regulator